MDESHRISYRLAKFRPSLTLILKTMAEERKQRGLPVFDFGLGETKGHLHDAIREAGERAFREEDTMYGDPAGLPEVRQAVLEWLGLQNEYTVDNVVITAGAKQALFNTFLAVSNPADAILFDAAPWVSYQPLVVGAYGFPLMVLPRSGDVTHLKVSGADLERNLKMRPHAKLFLLNNPVNPTAQLYAAGEIEDLLSVCVKHKVYFVLDRLYWKLVFDGETFPEPRIDEETRPWLIQIDGMSKNFRRTGGIRIGWSIGPADVTKAMINLQSHYTSGPAIPTQRAAQAAITMPYDATLVGEMQAKRDLLLREAENMPHVDIWPTPATFYSFWDVRGAFGLKTPKGGVIESSDDLSEYLVQEAGVIAAPGSGFMQDGYLRLSFAIPDDMILNGMAAARQALSKLRK